MLTSVFQRLKIAGSFLTLKHIEVTCPVRKAVGAQRDFSTLGEL